MKQWFFIIPVLVIITALFPACSNIGGSSTEERTTIPAEDSELTLEERTESQEETHWNPSPERTVGGGYLSSTSPSETVAYENLKLWVKNYQHGIPDQIYLDGSGLPVTYRLTCDGSETYKIEQQTAGGNPTPSVHYSSAVLEGAIHYTFGRDLNDGPTLTVIKEYATGKGLENAPASIADPITYQEAKKIAMSTNVDGYPIVPEEYVLSLDGYFSLQNVLFYKFKACKEDLTYNFHYVAISTDGSIVLNTGEMNNDIWYLVSDKNEQRIEWGEVRTPEDAEITEIPAKISIDDPLGLTGCWHDNQTMGSVHGDLYCFIKDGHFIYAAALNSTERLRLSTGKWWMEDETLYLSATHLLTQDADADTNAGMSLAEQLTVVHLTPGEQIVEAYPVKIIQDENYWDDAIMLGEQQLWRKDGEVTSYMAFFQQYHLIPFDYFMQSVAGTWHWELDENEEAWATENWYYFWEDGTYFGAAAHSSEDRPNLYMEGQWEQKDNYIQLIPLAEYQTIRLKEADWPVRIPVPATYWEDSQYRLELQASTEEFPHETTLQQHLRTYRRGQDKEPEAANLLNEVREYHDSISLEQLVTGFWHGDSAVGGVYADRYMLYENGVFAFANQGEFPGFTPPARRYSCGKWWVENNETLCFSATHEICMVDEMLIQREIPVEESGVKRYPVTLLPTTHDNWSGRFDWVHIGMGKYELWQMDGIGTFDMEDFLYTCYPEMKPTDYVMQSDHFG